MGTMDIQTCASSVTSAQPPSYGMGEITVHAIPSICAFMSPLNMLWLDMNVWRHFLACTQWPRAAICILQKQIPTQIVFETSISLENPVCRESAITGVLVVDVLFMLLVKVATSDALNSLHHSRNTKKVDGNARSLLWLS